MENAGIRGSLIFDQPLLSALSAPSPIEAGPGPADVNGGSLGGLPDFGSLGGGLPPPGFGGPYPPTGDSSIVAPAFGRHVNLLRSTMFYVCQGSCLCGTVNNRGKVIYCYGDLVPRHGELFEGGGESNGTTSSKDLLAALLGVWTFGIIALLIVLLLIRKSITSLKNYLERVSDRLPVYHDDDVLSSSHDSSGGASPKPTAPNNKDPGGAIDSVDHHHHDMFSDDGTLTPDPDLLNDDGSPIHIGVSRLPQSKGVPVESLKKMRLHRKDFRKGGEALRGKNVTDNFRVKEKEIKRTLK